MRKIVIDMSGGICHSVHGDVEDVEIILVDTDDGVVTEDDFLDEIKGLNEIDSRWLEKSDKEDADGEK